MVKLPPYKNQLPKQNGKVGLFHLLSAGSSYSFFKKWENIMENAAKYRRYVRTDKKQKNTYCNFYQDIL